MIVKASANRSIRWSNGMPNARNSVSFQPAPRPRTKRPPLISSRVSACFARTAGLWNAVQATSGPSRIRVVAAASPARRVQASQGPRVVAVGETVEEVIAQPDRVEAELLRLAGHRDDLAPADLAFDLRQLDADPDGAPADRRHGESGWHRVERRGPPSRLGFSRPALGGTRPEVGRRRRPHWSPPATRVRPRRPAARHRAIRPG